MNKDLKIKKMKQRRFTFTKANIEIMVDFGKEGSDELTCEVISKIKGDKREVMSANSLGRAKNWSYKRINEYLASMCDCKDLDEEGKEREAD